MIDEDDTEDEGTLDDLDNPNTSDTLAHALAHAARGFHVFPLKALSKIPAERRPWPELATTNQADIAAMFAGTTRNIGIACGPSRLVILDEDNPGAVSAIFTARGEPVPHTYTVRTAKGFHYYFTAPQAPIGNAANLKPFGIDVRGHGGYVVAAGSIHETGVPYEAITDTDPVPLPSWLTDLLAAPPRPASAPTTGQWEDIAPEPRGIERVPPVIAGPKPNSGGERHQVLVDLASSMRGRGLPRKEAEIIMREAWQRCEQPPACLTPMTWTDALTILADVWTRYTPNDTSTTVTPIIAATENDGAQLVPLEPLPALLAEPDEEVTYRIHGLLPAGARVVLAAQFKAGKTTIRDNLVRSLADGTPFLEGFNVTELPPGRSIAVLDNEMTRGQIKRWMRDQGIARPERIHVAILRGRVAKFNLLDPYTRAAWAEQLRQANAGVVVFDCLRPVLDALGLEEARDAGRFLTAFDALLLEAGVDEGVLIHHMGHNAERSRGDSRIRDWPDVEWRLVRERPKFGDEPDPSAGRYFSAYGRDVDIEESALTFDPETRHLTITHGEGRSQTRAGGLVGAVVAFVTDNPGCSKTRIETSVTGRSEYIREALDAAAERGLIRREPPKATPGQTQAHYPTTSTPSNPVPDVETHPRPPVYKDGDGAKAVVLSVVPDVVACQRCGNQLDRAAELSGDSICTDCNRRDEIGR